MHACKYLLWRWDFYHTVMVYLTNFDEQFILKKLDFSYSGMEKKLFSLRLLLLSHQRNMTILHVLCMNTETHGLQTHFKDIQEKTYGTKYAQHYSAF